MTTADREVRQTIDLGPTRLVIAGPKDPDAEVRAAEQRGDTSPGYWSLTWPAGVAMARYVTTADLIGPDTRVVELGCGLGLVGLACAARGCPTLLTDADDRAVMWAGGNAALNGLDCAVHRFAWGEDPDRLIHLAGHAFDGAGPDVVVAADILYDPADHHAIASLLRTLGVPALLADPCRHAATPALDAFTASGLTAWDALLSPSVRGQACRLIVVH